MGEQNRIDGEKTIIQAPSEAQRKEHEKFDFSVHEVYAVDVLISSGEGLGREKDAKITIYKKTDDSYMLKMKTSREFYSKVVNPLSIPEFVENEVVIEARSSKKKDSDEDSDEDSSEEKKHSDEDDD